jgi:iron(II)-dependent oxidoreductase
MQAKVKRLAVLGTIGAVSLVNLGFGWAFSLPIVLGTGAAGLAFAAWRLAVVLRRRPVRSKAPPPPEARPLPRRPARPVDTNDPDALVRQMLEQGRYALLLRPQVADNLRPEQLDEIRKALFAAMTLVPDGEVVMGQIDQALDDGKLDEDEIAQCQGRLVRVEHYLLDRYPVTNRQYYDFVAAGGYEQVALWDESIWPAVLDFVDQTGHPGPRYWRDGCFLHGRENHPVVGVSWFEAAAYARWLGKRLPTSAEWVKAGSWPVQLATARVQRRYPWGETMDRTRANLWGSGPGDTVPVDQFSGGVTVGGAYQLIGNVWEWTGSEFRGDALAMGQLLLEIPMKSIRGGAFDTYFDNQATCHFQSGEPAIARKHNVGFRLAVGVCDLVLARTVVQDAVPEEPATVPAEEVEV